MNTFRLKKSPNPSILSKLQEIIGSRLHAIQSNRVTIFNNNDLKIKGLTRLSFVNKKKKKCL